MKQTTERNLGEWLQYLNSIMVRWVKQSAAVIVDGADQMSTGEHTVDSCVKTVTRLADVALLNGVEYGVTVLAGTGFTMLASHSVSDWFDGPTNQSCAHSIEISAPLSRNVSDDPIPRVRIGFQVPTADGARQCLDVLPAGTTKFRLVVFRAGLHSGCYTGTVVLTPVPPAPGNPVAVDVDIEL